MGRKLPSLNGLHTFEAAARNMSFSLAAEELSVTQAAVSRQIRLLEEDLGVKLFRRLTRAVELTEEGAMLYPVLQESFHQIERVTSRIWGNRGNGILTISVLPTFSVKWLMPRLMNFAELYPEIEVHLINSIKPVNFERDEVDLAIRVGSTNLQTTAQSGPRIDLTMTRSWDGVQVEALMTDELVAVMSPDYFKVHGEILNEANLHSVTLLHIATRPNAWADYFKAIGWSPDLAVAGPAYGHFFMSIQAARDGKGIAIAPHILVEPELASGHLIRAMPQKIASAGRYYLLGRQRSWDHGKVKIFRKWLKAEIATSG